MEKWGNTKRNTNDTHMQNFIQIPQKIKTGVQNVFKLVKDTLPFKGLFFCSNPTSRNLVLITVFISILFYISLVFFLIFQNLCLHSTFLPFKHCKLFSLHFLLFTSLITLLCNSAWNLTCYLPMWFYTPGLVKGWLGPITRFFNITMYQFIIQFKSMYVYFVNYYLLFL